MTTIKSVFEDYNLILNEDKTEITDIADRESLFHVKKLGSLLDDAKDLKRRHQLCQIGLRKYLFIWKNKFITQRKKKFMIPQSFQF